MRTIETINKEYVEVMRALKAFRAYSETISDELRDFSVEAKIRFLNAMDHIGNLISETDCSQHAFLSDAIMIAMQYKSCLIAISEYQSALLNMSRGSKDANSALVIATANAVKNAQNNFNLANEHFQEEYKAPIKDVETLSNMYLR